MPWWVFRIYVLLEPQRCLCLGVIGCVKLTRGSSEADTPTVLADYPPISHVSLWAGRGAWEMLFLLNDMQIRVSRRYKSVLVAGGTRAWFYSPPNHLQFAGLSLEVLGA